jgi:hypothetical protein
MRRSKYYCTPFLRKVLRIQLLTLVGAVLGIEKILVGHLKVGNIDAFFSWTTVSRAKINTTVKFPLNKLDLTSYSA